jgi:MarR family transcriptional regulator, temperature-dependent positive regulator of motility
MPRLPLQSRSIGRGGDKMGANVAALERLDFGLLGSSVSYLIRRAQIDISRQYLSSVGKRNQVSYGEFCALILAAANPGIDQIQIALMLDLDKANTASLIRKLVQSGWMSRRQPMHDRRCQGVFLTPAGVTRLVAIKREMREFDERLCHTLNESERVKAVELLQKICFRS